MPRKYIKKTETKYNMNDLQLAINAVKTKKMTLGLASITYSVPKTTIHDRLKKEEHKFPKKGRLPIFDAKQEKALARYIIDCCKTFYGITIASLRKIAYNFAVTNKLKHNFNHETRMAGMDWYYSFISRHSYITLRTPEFTSLDRITALNESEVRIFFRDLTELQKKYKFKADSIYNIDETGVTTVHKNSKILAPKGLKQVGKVTSGERGVTTTVVCASSAGGNYIPPMFIFKRKRMTDLLMKGCNNNMIATVSDSGWMNESIFVEWLYHFISHAEPSKEKPVLLIFDNHESHISLKLYTLYRDYGIHALSLPHHTSHRMQPLDLTFFGPLKSAYSEECELYMANNPGQRITQYGVGELFTNAYNRIANIDKAANRFKAAGIFPMNSEKLNDLFVTQHGVSLPMDHSTSTQTISTTDIPVTLTSPSAEVRDVPNQAALPSDTDNTVPLIEIVNVPIIHQNKPAIIRKRTKKHSEILYSSPMKTQLEDKQKGQMENKMKKEDQPLTKKKTVMTIISAATITKENEPLTKKKETEIRGKAEKGKGVKNLKSFKKCHNNKGIDYFCIFCAERYVSPPTEDWIMCMTCRQWAHESCTSGESTSKGFVCNICKKNSSQRHKSLITF